MEKPTRQFDEAFVLGGAKRHTFWTWALGLGPPQPPPWFLSTKFLQGHLSQDYDPACPAPVTIVLAGDTGTIVAEKTHNHNRETDRLQERTQLKGQGRNNKGHGNWERVEILAKQEAGFANRTSYWFYISKTIRFPRFSCLMGFSRIDLTSCFLLAMCL